MADPNNLSCIQVSWGWPKCIIAEMRLLGQPQGSWFSLETLHLAFRCQPQFSHFQAVYSTLRSASRYFGQPWNTQVSLKVSASRYLGQPWNTQVSLKVLGSAMEHLGQFSHKATGSASGYLDKPLSKRVIYRTLKLASSYLDQPWKTCVSLKGLWKAKKQLCQQQNTWISRYVVGQLWKTWISYGTLGADLSTLRLT
jgi:hypothetical protein